MKTYIDILSQVKYDDKGLVPVVVQDIATSEILMLAYMNRESLQKTLDSGFATYWSRSRQSFWVKGETSGHFQHVEEIDIDCDGDTLLMKVKQLGAACHTGNKTCFYRKIADI